MTSPEIKFEPLGPDDYDRAKKILDAAKHPGFVGREFMFRCATKGHLIVASIEGVDAGLVAIDHKGVLQALSVAKSAQGSGVGTALVAHVRKWAQWVKAIDTRVSYFQRLGYEPYGAATIGAKGKFGTQLMRRNDDVSLDITATLPTKDRDNRPDRARNCSDMALPEFIDFASGGMHSPPWHLGAYFDLCCSLGEPTSHLTQEEIIARTLHICVSVPPQHAKTTTIQYTIAWLLFRFPHLVFGFGSYAKLYSSERTEEIMRIYVNAGGELMKDHARKADWRTAGGGGCLAFSPDSGISGYKLHHIVFDDFVHDETDLETEDKRKAVHREIDLATQRLWVGGSIIMIATRWHPEDPIGYLLAKGYTEINLPAVREIDGVDHALWPDEKPLAWLDTKRLPSSKEFVGAYAWETQYQGKPVPPEGSVFGPPRWYTSLPGTAQVVVIGFDFGYGPEGTSDFSVAVVLARDDAGTYYVHDVKRVRTTLHDMAVAFKTLMTEHPYPVRYGCYMGGNEKGILNLLFVEDVSIERMPARHSKHTRSQRCAVAWRAGRILVRSGQPWSARFAREVEYFTGNERGHDDQVDALVSGFDLVELTAALGWEGGFTFGKAVL